MGNDCCRNENVRDNAKHKEKGEMVSQYVGNLSPQSDPAFRTEVEPIENHGNRKIFSQIYQMCIGEDAKVSGVEHRLETLDLNFCFNMAEHFMDGLKPSQDEHGRIYYGNYEIDNMGNKQIHGTGFLVWAHKSLYVGHFNLGLHHGPGLLINPDSSYYQGSFQFDKANGFGTLVEKDGTKYSGEFIDDDKHGNGVETRLDGHVYEGEFRANFMHGDGKLVYPDGDCYEGGFAAGVIHGTGVYTWADARVYRGDFDHGLREGEGTFTWPDGTFYKGNWAADQKHGYGEFRLDDGKVYKGMWEKGFPAGNGILWNPHDQTVCKTLPVG